MTFECVYIMPLRSGGRGHRLRPALRPLRRALRRAVPVHAGPRPAREARADGRMRLHVGAGRGNVRVSNFHTTGTGT